jgi:hypothetical protein
VCMVEVRSGLSVFARTKSAALFIPHDQGACLVFNANMLIRAMRAHSDVGDGCPGINLSASTVSRDSREQLS